MEKISINTLKKQYEIEFIRPISNNIIQIKFSNDIPNIWGDIHIYTSGGQKATTLTGYTTVYRDDGQIIYLSNDGTVYTIPEEVNTPEGTLPPEPFIPNIEEVRLTKKRTMSRECELSIYNGVDVTLEDGSIEHFSLTEHDQLNLFGKQAQLASGITQLEYHADGQPCRYYSSADMQRIIEASMFHVSYHTTYCNSMYMWIDACSEIEEIESICYGLSIPTEYKTEVLVAYEQKITEMKNSSIVTENEDVISDSNEIVEESVSETAE